MTKKKDCEAEIPANQPVRKIKKSKSAESLTTQPPEKQIQELKDQVKFEANKSQNYLNQITTLTAEVDGKEQAIKELTAEKNQLIDQYNELRINNLQQKDYFTKYQQESKLTNQLKLQLAKLQKDLTIVQQDLKSAQGIIELRLTKTDDKNRQEINYWPWIRMGSLVLLIYLLSKEK